VIAAEKRAAEQAARDLLAQATGLDIQPIEEDLSLDAMLASYAYNVAALVASKQRDYGPRAINDAPGGALNGIHVRLHDKLARATNLSGRWPHPAGNESLYDTYMDIAGYALIAMLYLDGEWPA
jgi:hypothetical protein